MKFLAGQNRKGLTFILLALVCGFMAALIVFSAGTKMKPTVPVLIATQDITAGDPLHDGLFEEVLLPPAGVPEGAIRPGIDLRQFIAKKGLSQGDVLRIAGLLELENPDPSLLSARLRSLDDPSLQGMEIPVSAAVGMLSGMNAGDKVNVISVFKIDSDSSDSELVAETILIDVPVIGVRPPGDAEGALIVAVNEQQGEQLALAREKGKVFAALRPFGLASPTEAEPTDSRSNYVSVIEEPVEYLEEGRLE